MKHSNPCKIHGPTDNYKFLLFHDGQKRTVYDNPFTSKNGPGITRSHQTHHFYAMVYLITNSNSANETILHDEDVMKILGVSKRKIEYMKANREIPFFNPPMQCDYFMLSDILEWLQKSRVESISNERRV